MRLTILLALLPVLANGHMEMITPFALNQQQNPNAKSGAIDYNYAAPLDVSGSNYPCKGHLSALGGAAGASVATWQAGSTQSFTIKGGASHMGGSCQASLSEDGGKSFRVMKSYIGGCPVPDKAFTFTVPKEAKNGPAVFAWTWFNNQGNREMYMNCASVTIANGGSGMGASYPYIFRANIGNGCTTEGGKDVVFPNPGNDVEKSSTKMAPPIGDCGPAGPGPVQAGVGYGKLPQTTQPTNAAQATRIAPSGTAVTVGKSPAATKSAQPPAKSAEGSTPPSTNTPPRPSRKGCSCVCDGYTFQFSADEL
ncbi:hypothetical protein HOY82DRAFT_536094 [Tuber indicum]|nr:hypothetical protein HOY82DRAFT_536094 [Tuber indicum]